MKQVEATVTWEIKCFGRRMLEKGRVAVTGDEPKDLLPAGSIVPTLFSTDLAENPCPSVVLSGRGWEYRGLVGDFATHVAVIKNGSLFAWGHFQDMLRCANEQMFGRLFAQPVAIRWKECEPVRLIVDIRVRKDCYRYSIS